MAQKNRTGAGGNRTPLPSNSPRFLLEQAIAGLPSPLQDDRAFPAAITMLHRVERQVQKNRLEVAGIDFWAEQLRPYVGLSQKIEVRYDAAAADRGHLAKVFVVLDRGLGEAPEIVRCEPRALVQDTADRDAVAANARRYAKGLNEQVEAAAVGYARRRGGAAAGDRQQAIHETRRRQGRAGQEQSGYSAPKPEVEVGVRRHAADTLRRKVRNAKKRGEDVSSNDAADGSRSSPTKHAKSTTQRKTKPRGSSRPGRAEPSPSAAGAKKASAPWQDPWSRIATAADVKPRQRRAAGG